MAAKARRELAKAGRAKLAQAPDAVAASNFRRKEFMVHIEAPNGHTH
jgi:hypothetical protein